MKRTLFSIFLMIGFCYATKADTIDYCHVHYNHVKRWDFGIYKGDYKITLHKNDIKKEDSIQIFYFEDRPCSACKNKLIWSVELSRLFFINEAHGCYTIALQDLISQMKLAGLNETKVYYSKASEENNALQIFTISIL